MMKRLTMVGLMVLTLMIVGTAVAEAGPVIGIDLDNFFAEPLPQRYYQSKIKPENGEPPRTIELYKTWSQFKAKLVEEGGDGYTMDDVIGAIQDYVADEDNPDLPSKVHFAFIGFNQPEIPPFDYDPDDGELFLMQDDDGGDVSIFMAEKDDQFEEPNEFFLKGMFGEETLGFVSLIPYTGGPDGGGSCGCDAFPMWGGGGGILLLSLFAARRRARGGVRRENAGKAGD